MLEFRNVLCPVDFSPLSHRALALSVEVCKKLRARLVLEHNLDARPPSYLGVSWMWSEDHEKGEEGKAERATERMRELFAEIPSSISYEAKLTRGPIDSGLAYLARQLPADLIVMGTHGPTSPEHSSLTERVILQAACTVLTLGESYDPASVMTALSGRAGDTMTVMVPIDFSERSRRALDFGLALARRMPHRLHLVHVLKPAHGGDQAVPPAEIEAARRRLKELIPEEFADRMSVEIKCGWEADCLLQEARRCEAIFILMAAEGRSAFKRFLFGDTTRAVLHGSECPVLFVPPAYRLPATKSRSPGGTSSEG